MPTVTLSSQIGLLIAICAERSYFSRDKVHSLEIAWEQATSQYGEAGVPSPDEVIFQSWDGKPVLIGSLVAPEQKFALPFVRCAAASMQSVGRTAIDMLVLLIGPEGSDADPEWLRAAAAIEIDDRVCRKLVWLPGVDAARSADEFLAKTPFARPWRVSRPLGGDVSSFNQLAGDEDDLDRIALQADQVGASPADFVRNALASLDG